jgi:O-antigen/teichoic acid export membrane protein
LVEYHKELGASLAQTLMPFVGAMDARGEKERLRQVLIQGTRAALLVSWPVEVLLWYRGETFIALWMGPQFAAPAAAVLRILLISNFLMAGHSVSGNITFGLGKHKVFALWRVGEAAANLVMSLILVRIMGINGVAWGTTIPSLFIHVLFWPMFITRLVGMPLSEYVIQAWGRTAIAVLPFAFACYFVEGHWQPARLIDFVLQTAVTLPVLILGLAVVFQGDLRSSLNDPDGALRRVMKRKATQPAA